MIRNLKSGVEAREIDVLRLAMQHLLRSGWSANGRFSTGAGALSIESALERARRELQAPWMAGVRASEALREQISAPRSYVGALPRYERQPERTQADVLEIFKATILSKMEPVAGTLADVTV